MNTPSVLIQHAGGQAEVGLPDGIVMEGAGLRRAHLLQRDLRGEEIHDGEQAAVVTVGDNAQRLLGLQGGLIRYADALEGARGLGVGLPDLQEARLSICRRNPWI